MMAARKIILTGKVQGVGFRPFVFRLAKSLDLDGWVRNCTGQVEIHVQGAAENVQLFAQQLFSNKPPISQPVLHSDQPVSPQSIGEFKILQSELSIEPQIHLPIDLFLCNDCLHELNDAANRRYRYPFINCTQCGPRFTLIKKLPYDRKYTTMASFGLCADCTAEYENPADRRFHAEPVACEKCGPSLSFYTESSGFEHGNERSIALTVNALHAGKIVAVKGIGGYHLMCDASNDAAVIRLRKRKSRMHKPLAIMCPATVDDPFLFAQRYVHLSVDEKDFLLDPSRSILLVKKRSPSELSSYLAPRLNEVGLMLPYSPLHHLLLNDINRPLVVTSANISGEPVLTEEQAVMTRLGHIADAYLHHNREIVRPADDSVYRMIAGKARPLRIGRGTTPLEVTLPFELDRPVLAVGAQMKNTIALAWGNRVVVSPHIGEMHSMRSLQVFEQTINDLQSLYDVKIEQLVCDRHPAYTTHQWSKRHSLPVFSVLHHHAHASSVYYETNCDTDVIVFSWDGTGYGEDASLWGGETLIGHPSHWQRAGSMRAFYLPGGEKAGREPWRSAAALCWEVGVDYKDLPHADDILKQAWAKKINTPRSSSVGRLFDAAAAICNQLYNVSYEGQAAMQFEAQAGDLHQQSGDYIELPVDRQGDLYITDWEPLLHCLLDEHRSASQRACIFHGTLALALLRQAMLIRDEHSLTTVCFSGGVFQNRALTEYATSLLQDNGFTVCIADKIPLNDAAISFGQIIEYAYNTRHHAC